MTRGERRLSEIRRKEEDTCKYDLNVMQSEGRAQMLLLQMNM